MRRARALEQFMLASQDNGEDAPVYGHEIELLTRGFEGEARLGRLLVGALDDLATRARQGGALPSDLRAYLAVPDPRRIYSQTDLIANEGRRKSREADRDAVPAEPIHEFAERLWARATRQLGWAATPRLVHTSTGRAGFSVALAAALRDMRARETEVALVGGVDSLLDMETLEWLHDSGHLKYVDMPVGIEPGEAAAFVLVEKRPQGRALCSVVAASPIGSSGGRYVEAIQQVQSQVGGSDPLEWALPDHDGTEALASAWGEALFAFKAQSSRAPHSTYPIATFGDVGAAFGAVATCIAIEAWSRRYAPARSVVIAAVSEPQCAAHLLRAIE